MEETVPSCLLSPGLFPLRIRQCCISNVCELSPQPLGTGATTERGCRLTDHSEPEGRGHQGCMCFQGTPSYYYWWGD